MGTFKIVGKLKNLLDFATWDNSVLKAGNLMPVISYALFTRPIQVLFWVNNPFLSRLQPIKMPHCTDNQKFARFSVFLGTAFDLF